MKASHPAGFHVEWEATLLGIVGNGTIVRRLGLRFRGRSRLSIDRRNRIPRLGLRLFEGLALEGELTQQTFAFRVYG